MENFEHNSELRLKEFNNLKWELFENVSDIFRKYIRNPNLQGCCEDILDAFLVFESKSSYVLNFEFHFNDFKFYYEDLNEFNYSNEEWLSIYGLFKEVFKFENKLNTFIYLFFYDLIYCGPFGEDIESLDMSDDLLSLMGKDMLMLYDLFDDYFNNHDVELITRIVEASKQDSIPYFIVIHLANWINDDIGDKQEFGDLICELYKTALNKIHRKPNISDEDFSQINSIIFQVDTSGFYAEQIERVYSILE